MKKLFAGILAAVIVLSLGFITAFARANMQEGSFVDSNGDGVCDNYGTAACQNKCSNWADNNGDGICDNYGTAACHGRNARQAGVGLQQGYRSCHNK